MTRFGKPGRQEAAHNVESGETMGWNRLDDISLAGKRVLVRVDVNVPVQDDCVTDDSRIRRMAPTIGDILAKGGQPILLAHFGRPNGRRDPDMSLLHLIPKLEEILRVPVHFCSDCRGPAAEAAAGTLPKGAALLLENTRFHAGEEQNSPELSLEMAKLGDIYCNDAFSCAHRAHASTEGLARFLPNCAGRLMEAELRALESALETPERPLMAIVGGAKVSTKLRLLGNLLKKVDYLVVGGGMANTFLAAQGMDVGRSLSETGLTDTARQILEQARKGSCQVILPTDMVVARQLAANTDHWTVDSVACPPDAMILDAGPRSVAMITGAMKLCRTLVWNGPLGAFEFPPFDTATKMAAREAMRLTLHGRLVTVAGGGDTVAALNQASAAKGFTYVSTAGGAFLEWMEGRRLPGVAALES